MIRFISLTSATQGDRDPGWINSSQVLSVRFPHKHEPKDAASMVALVNGDLWACKETVDQVLQQLEGSHSTEHPANPKNFTEAWMVRSGQGLYEHVVEGFTDARILAKGLEGGTVVRVRIEELP